MVAYVGYTETRRTDMTKLQQIYRELRKYMTAEDARYAAPRLIEAWDAAANRS